MRFIILFGFYLHPILWVTVPTISTIIYPTNIYLFKVNNKNIEKGVKYVQS